MLPRAVLTHLKAGVRAAFGPDPVLTRLSAGTFAAEIGIVDLDPAGQPLGRITLKHDLPQLVFDLPGGDLRANPATVRLPSTAAVKRPHRSCDKVEACRSTSVWDRRRAASRTCRSSRLINQRVDRVPLCVGHTGMTFAADREAVPQCVQLGDRF